MRTLLVSLICFCSAIFGSEPPVSPGETEWPFATELAAPMSWHPHWTRTECGDDEANLRQGVQIHPEFPDAEGLLETAHADMKAFFSSVGLSTNGPFRIVTERVPTQKREAFTLRISKEECRVQANDTEGIRRGIYFLEDQLLRADGPFLDVGEISRSPFIQTRISRCFFGPIKRPPMNRDELLDDVDYYPDGYLNRLAHDGVNGLWLTIEFKDLCKTSLIPDCSPDREKRLEKLRKTVAKCRRYGIKVFLFCIEPCAMTAGHPLLVAHPELSGAELNASTRLFCPFSEAAQTYLREAIQGIFAEVPNLGGLINISYGEAPTTCLSAADANWHINCPRCAEKQPWEVLNATLSPMEQGMHEAAPDAKLISWLYVPESGPGTPLPSVEPLTEMARHTPPGVVVQYNFESGGHKTQLGKQRQTGDYWLSYVGPSAAFEQMATAVASAGQSAEISAKIQACCSHEVASAPYVPVPGQLYGKYGAMRELGVTSVMQCWYFGNLPCLMNRAAASELPFMKEGISEEQFLLDLACRDWGSQYAPRIVKAWRLFAKAYDNYPMTNAFQFYGPMTDGVVWPLHLKPVHLPLGPTWRLDYPISGDRIGECFSGTHTYPEVLELCKNLSETWQRGVELLDETKDEFAGEPDREQDLSVAEALGIQFRSGYNILRFYDLREQLLYGPKSRKKDVLRDLRALVEQEIENSQHMSALCEENSFLGFHAEAEGYKYFPAKLTWRVDALREMLDTEFSEAERALEIGQNVFPGLCGLEGSPLVYHCLPASKSFASAWRTDDVWHESPGSPKIEQAPLAPAPSEAHWQAVYDDQSLYLNVECDRSAVLSRPTVVVHIQSSHIYPRRTFQIDANGQKNERLGWRATAREWDVESVASDKHHTVRLRIPFTAFDGEFDRSRPMCINVRVQSAGAEGANALVQSWAPLSPTPPRFRLGYGEEDPREMGWLRLEP
ncbi:MAG: hypothetical protein K1Y02_06280 [Candidatus Hydrogenedentes bacterium]|nr:hypothetical protein [Candidatus Hydrogenedentota bacterium]